MTLEIRELALDDAADVAAYCATRSAFDPDEAETPEGIAWEDKAYPGQVWRFLARLDGEPAGAATTGRMHVYAPEYPRFYLGLWVPRAPRQAEIQEALYRALSRAARAAGKSGFRCWVSEVHYETVAFLASAGFAEVDRSKAVALALRPHRDAGDLGPIVPPDGFDIVTLANRRDLIPGVHRCAAEAFPSIPSATPMDPGSLEEFTARDIDRDRIPLQGFFVAIDVASGEVAGYANLIFAPGSTTIAHHDMTAVRPAFRGRGLALALKRATIAWAARSGLDELRANNDEENAPMRGINARLGYRPLPDEIGLEGPLAD